MPKTAIVIYMPMTNKNEYTKDLFICCYGYAFITIPGNDN